MRPNRYAFIATILLCSTCRIANADYIVASNLAASETYSYSWDGVGVISQNNNNNNLAAGQSFTPQGSGLLTTVDALIGAAESEPIPNSPPLDISIFTSVNSVPVTRLGTIQKHASDFPTILLDVEHRYSIDFSHFQIPLVAGEHYFIAFQTPNGIPGLSEADSPYFIGLEPTWANPNPTLLGETCAIAPNGNDWQLDQYGRELEITVHAIPEPSSFALYLIAASLLRTTRR